MRSLPHSHSAYQIGESLSQPLSMLAEVVDFAMVHVFHQIHCRISETFVLLCREETRRLQDCHKECQSPAFPCSEELMDSHTMGSNIRLRHNKYSLT